MAMAIAGCVADGHLTFDTKAHAARPAVDFGKGFQEMLVKRGNLPVWV